MSHPADVWVQAVSGELVRAAAIVGLRCSDGKLEAVLAGGASLRLAGPDCPADFDRAYLAELARARGSHDDRGLVILRPALAGEPASWTWSASRKPSS